MKPRSLPLLLVTLMLLGCGGKATEKKEDPKDGGDKQQAGAGDALKVQVKSWDETLELVASKKGKVVVIDLWALW